MSLEPGQIVDHYRLEQAIHRGRTTVVYAATDLRHGRKVAFKVLGERYATDRTLRRRFVNEAQAAASLDAHPHIVTVHKWGEFAGSMYFVTELIDGISLAELLERQPGGRPLPPDEALQLLEQIADALDFAHARGAIHGDVKPANVMVKTTETPRRAYLVDFGITKMYDGENWRPGEFVGTPDYASPEQISGAHALDRRSDVYSLACTAFAVLTGRPPFGDAPDDAARFTAHLQRSVPSARAIRPQLPAAIDGVLAKALAKNREDRYGSCGELVRELRATYPAGTHVLRHAAPPGAELPAPSLYRDAAGLRRTWPWVAVGVAFALLATTVAYFVTARGEPEITAAIGPGRTATTTATTTTTASTTTTTTTTTPPTTTTDPGPFGPLGPPVAAGDSAQAAFAVGVQTRRPGSELAAPGSAAMLYAEWARLVTGGEAGRSRVRLLDDAGFLVEVDERVALRDVQFDPAGRATDVRECRAGGPCVFVSDRLLRGRECEPADGCPTVDSDSGALRAVQIATLLLRLPAQHVLYELRTTEQITRVSDPARVARWDGRSDFLLLRFDDRPETDTTLRLTITYASGTTDRLTMNFDAPFRDPDTNGNPS